MKRGRAIKNEEEERARKKKKENDGNGEVRKTGKINACRERTRERMDGNKVKKIEISNPHSVVTTSGRLARHSEVRRTRISSKNQP